MIITEEQLNEWKSQYSSLKDEHIVIQDLIDEVERLYTSHCHQCAAEENLWKNVSCCGRFA